MVLTRHLPALVPFYRGISWSTGEYDYLFSLFVGERINIGTIRVFKKKLCLAIRERGDFHETNPTIRSIRPFMDI